MHLEFNRERNTMVEHWLEGNLSDNCMRESLGLYHYDGVDYPKMKGRGFVNAKY